eukprot:GEMP01056902.1.p1 GENE.GEMP01056902.1~~GEMP01056902.1.p1  ORF type:complete len:193 (+),score=38.11 GEMP01056902.1:548-1126(+)
MLPHCEGHPLIAEAKRRASGAEKVLHQIKSKKIDLGRVFFSDEKMFRRGASGKYGRDEVVWSGAPKKSLVDAKLLLKDQEDAKKGIMVAMAISEQHAAPSYFCTPGVKIDSTYYCDAMMAQHFSPHMSALMPEDFFSSKITHRRTYPIIRRNGLKNTRFAFSEVVGGLPKVLTSTHAISAFGLFWSSCWSQG